MNLLLGLLVVYVRMTSELIIYGGCHHARVRRHLVAGNWYVSIHPVRPALPFSSSSTDNTHTRENPALGAKSKAHTALSNFGESTILTCEATTKPDVVSAVDLLLSSTAASVVDGASLSPDVPIQSQGQSKRSWLWHAVSGRIVKMSRSCTLVNQSKRFQSHVSYLFGCEWVRLGIRLSLSWTANQMEWAAKKVYPHISNQSCDQEINFTSNH